jgi:hypothetical protein
MNDDDERIAQALQRQAQGLALSRHDVWCLKVHERHERREHREATATDFENMQE